MIFGASVVPAIVKSASVRMSPLLWAFIGESSGF